METATTNLNDIRLKRRCLGLGVGGDDIVYLADPETSCVYVLPRDLFVRRVKGGRIAAQRWHVSVPRRDCLFKTLTLPATSDEELREMLAFEVPGLLPAQDGEICYDFRCEGGGDSSRRVWLAIAPLERLTRSIAPLQEAGITPDALIPSCVALQHCLRRWAPDGVLDGDSLVIAVDEQEYQAVALAAGRVVAARQVSGDAAPDVAGLLEDAERHLQPWQPGEPGEPARAIEHVVLAGDGDRVRALADRIPPADPDGRHASPAVTVVESRMDVRRGEAAASAWSVGAACALGAALAEESQRGGWLNLVPPSWTRRRRRRRLWIDRAVKAALVLACLGLLHTYLLARVYRLERQREAVLRQIDPIRETAAALEAQKQQVRAVQAQLAGRSLPLRILLELYRKVPAGIFLSHLTMSPPDVTIRGTAGSLDLAFGFPMVLEGSGLFKDVRPDGAQQVNRDRGNLIEYGCRCRVDGYEKVQ